MPNEVEFVSYIFTDITGDPHGFDISRQIDDRGVLLTANVDQKHMGRIMGKGAQTIMSVRYLLKALGMKNGERYKLKIIERA